MRTDSKNKTTPSADVDTSPAGALRKHSDEASGAIETVKATVTDFDDRIDRCRSIERSCDRAPLPRAEGKANARAFVSRRAAVFMRDKSREVLADRGLLSPSASLTTARGLRFDRHCVVADQLLTFDGLCAVMPDLALQMLDRLIDAVDYVEGPPDAERASVCQAAARERAELELARERFVDEVNGTGLLQIAHRPEVVARREAGSNRARQQAANAEARRIQEEIDQRESATAAQGSRTGRSGYIESGGKMAPAEGGR